MTETPALKDILKDNNWLLTPDEIDLLNKYYNNIESIRNQVIQELSNNIELWDWEYFNAKETFKSLDWTSDLKKEFWTWTEQIALFQVYLNTKLGTNRVRINWRPDIETKKAFDLLKITENFKPDDYSLKSIAKRYWIGYHENNTAKQILESIFHVYEDLDEIWLIEKITWKTPNRQLSTSNRIANILWVSNQKPKESDSLFYNRLINEGTFPEFIDNNEYSPSRSQIDDPLNTVIKTIIIRKLISELNFATPQISQFPKSSVHYSFIERIEESGWIDKQSNQTNDDLDRFWVILWKRKTRWENPINYLARLINKPISSQWNTNELELISEILWINLKDIAKLKKGEPTRYYSLLKERLLYSKIPEFWHWSKDEDKNRFVEDYIRKTIINYGNV